MTDKAPGYDSQGVPTIGTRIKELEAERDKLLQENDMLRAAMGIPYGRREADETTYIQTTDTSDNNRLCPRCSNMEAE